MAFLVLPKRPDPTPRQRAENWPKWHPVSNYETTRKFAFAYARACEGYGIAPDEAISFIMSVLPEDKLRHAQDAVEIIYGTLGEHRNPTVKPDIAKVDEIVLSSKLILADLVLSASNVKADTAAILQSLFHRQALVCVGAVAERPEVIELSGLLPEPEQLSEWQFIVPNGMRKRSGKTKEGKPSKRCLDNACLEENRRWTILECDFKKQKEIQPGVWKDTIWRPSIERWESAGIDVRTASLRVTAKFLTDHKLKTALVVHSGSVSLHFWLNVFGMPETEKTRLMADAPLLGHDPATWRISQWCRMPNGTRENGKRQPVLYYNPEALPKTKGDR